jgi:hypothetical protein
MLSQEDMQEWTEKNRVCMARAKLEKAVEKRLMFGTFLESKIHCFSSYRICTQFYLFPMFSLKMHLNTYCIYTTT